MQTEPTKTISYAEESLLLLIEKSMARMKVLDELCEKMPDEPKIFRLWVECVEKLAGVLERLFKIQNYNGGKDASGKEVQTGNNTNNIVLISSADLLNRIESKFYGVKTRADAYK
jgi:hypothetical protein